MPPLLLKNECGHNLDISFHEPVMKVTQGEIENGGTLENFGLPETWEQKLTEMGKSYLTESYKEKLNQQMSKIMTLIRTDVDPELLEAERGSLQVDFIKEEFLARCEGAMKSIKYMDELNSAKTLQEVGA